jgi:hypothetical protein
MGVVAGPGWRAVREIGMVAGPGGPGSFVVRCHMTHDKVV